MLNGIVIAIWTPLLGKEEGIREMFDHLGRDFKGEQARVNGGEVAAILGLIVGLAVVGFAISRFMRRDRGMRSNTPQGLFQELCRAHGLDHASRALLKQLATIRGYEHPAQLFLDPLAFQERRLPTALAPHAARIQSLRNKLFGDLNAIEDSPRESFPKLAEIPA